MENRISIGKILKTHGFKGHVKTYIAPEYMPDFRKNISAVFINGLPYFIRHKDINSEDQAILLLEEIETKEQAQKLCGKSIDIPADQLEQVYEAEHFADWIGFSVYDRKLGDLGTVTGIQELPQQVLLEVQNRGREVLIPLNDDLVPEVDLARKKVVTELPEGFLDIF